MTTGAFVNYVPHVYRLQNEQFYNSLVLFLQEWNTLSIMDTYKQLQI